jgi:ribosomal protein L37AE/L43A
VLILLHAYRQFFLSISIRSRLSSVHGRAIAQAVSHWLPTTVARVQARVWSCGICGGQSGAGAGFLWVLRFPLPIFIPPIAPQSPSSIIWGWYNRPEVAAVPSGLNPAPLRINSSAHCVYGNTNRYEGVRCEAFTAAEVYKIFSGYWSCQLGKNYKIAVVSGTISAPIGNF